MGLLILVMIVLFFALLFSIANDGDNESPKTPSANAAKLKTKDPLENKCDGENSTNWTHVNVCNKCLSFVSSDERLTNICLSCGESFDWVNSSASTRKIVRGKKWVTQVRYRGKNYINKVLYKNDS